MPNCKECGNSFGFLELKNGVCKRCIKNAENEARIEVEQKQLAARQEEEAKRRAERQVKEAKRQAEQRAADELITANIARLESQLKAGLDNLSLDDIEEIVDIVSNGEGYRHDLPDVPETRERFRGLLLAALGDQRLMRLVDIRMNRDQVAALQPLGIQLQTLESQLQNTLSRLGSQITSKQTTANLGAMAGLMALNRIEEDLRDD